RVRAPRRVLEAERLHRVPELRHRRCGRSACKPRPDDDDRVLALVGGVHQLHFEAVLLPLLVHRPRGDVGFEFHYLRIPNMTATGIETYPTVIADATAIDPARIGPVYFGWLSPIVWHI